MTWHGWLTLGTEILLIGLTLGAISRLGPTLLRLWRYHQCRREMRRVVADQLVRDLACMPFWDDEDWQDHRAKVRALRGAAVAMDQRFHEID